MLRPSTREGRRERKPSFSSREGEEREADLRYSRRGGQRANWRVHLPPSKEQELDKEQEARGGGFVLAEALNSCFSKPRILQTVDK